jgi:hypothetical protein
MALRDKYNQAIQVAKGFKMDGSADERDGKLHFHGTVHSEDEKNKIWDAIKSVPSWQQEVVADIKVAPAPAGAAQAAPSQTTYTVKPGETKSDIEVRLLRALSLSGRVIAEDTERPLAGFAVFPYSYRRSGPGRFFARTGPSAKTDAQGRFRLERLEAGDYYLQVTEPLARTIEEAKSVEDFRNAAEKVYAEWWYPGVARDAALPLTLIEGIAVEGIEVKIPKRRVASIRGRIFGGEHAAEGNEVSVMLGVTDRQIVGRSFGVVARGKLKTGSTFQVDRVSPGTYWLSAELPAQTERDRQWAVLTFQVADENIDGLDLHLRNGLTISGRVRIEGREPKPDEPVLPDGDVQVDLSPLIRVSSTREKGATVRASDGAFILEGRPADRYVFSVWRTPNGYKVSEVRYNGSACPHGIVAIDPAAQDHRIDVTLAEANGSVIATITDGTKAIPGAPVLIAPEPINDQVIYMRALREARADRDGRATIGDLLPGAYRVVAYPEGTLWPDDTRLRDRLAAGDQVRVTARQSATVQVRAQEAP